MSKTSAVTTLQNDPAELERLRAEVLRLRAREAARSTISMKVSEKGALSVYGLGRFPVTLYQSQWERILTITEDIKTFIATHANELKQKE